MSTVAIGPAAPDDAHLLRQTVRHSDEEECMAAHGLDVLSAATRAIDISAFSWSAFIDGNYAALFGVAQSKDNPGRGVPWLIGTNALDDNPTVLIRNSRAWLAKMFDGFNELENYVHAENEAAIRWLEWLGFHMSEPELMGPHLEDFRYFHMTKQEWEEKYNV